MDEFSKINAVARMHSRKKLIRRECLFCIESKDQGRVVAALGSVGCGIPFERNNATYLQCFLQSRLALEQRCLVKTTLCEKRSKNECAERDSQDARLRAQNALFDGQKGIAELSNTKGRHPNLCEGNNECGRCRKDRSAE